MTLTLQFLVLSVVLISLSLCVRLARFKICPVVTIFWVMVFFCLIDCTEFQTFYAKDRVIANSLKKNVCVLSISEWMACPECIIALSVC